MLCAIGLAACTTYRPIGNLPTRELAQKIEEGARVRVVTSDGGRVELRVTAVGEDYLEGVTPDGRTGRIEFDDMRQIERRAVAPAKTASLAGGAVLVYVFVAVGVAVYAIVTGF